MTVASSLLCQLSVHSCIADEDSAQRETGLQGQLLQGLSGRELQARFADLSLATVTGSHCLRRSRTLGGPGSGDDSIALSVRTVPLKPFVGVSLPPPTGSKPCREMSVSLYNLKIPIERTSVAKLPFCWEAVRVLGPSREVSSLTVQNHCCLSSVSPSL